MAPTSNGHPTILGAAQQRSDQLWHIGIRSVPDAKLALVVAACSSAAVSRREPLQSPGAPTTREAAPMVKTAPLRVTNTMVVPAMEAATLQTG
jgi:hypothetical protein